MDQELKDAMNSIKPEALLEHVRILSSDEFEGRAPGSVGEDRSIEYLIRQCKQLGLRPAAQASVAAEIARSKEDAFLQKVPVTGLRAKPSVAFHSSAQELALSFPHDYVAWSRHKKPEVNVTDSEVVFVGYGIVAPEYGWDDYKDVDVKGKTIVMLIGDPQRPDPKDPNLMDESFFRGRGMTYYGRWTYKYEIASERGAAAAFIVHETKPAGYGYDVVTSSWSGENFNLDLDEHRVKVEGWLSLESTEKLLALGRHDLESLKAKATSPDFRPVDLDAKASITIANTMRTFDSHNVIAKIEGSDPELKKECIVYSAHWDHFGVGEKDGVRGIFSGAMDNASGVSAVLEIAHAFSRLLKAPRRTILFLFTTLEERGLLGAQYYVKHPVIPLKDTVAIINFDVMNVWGRTKQVVSIAQGHSSLDEVLQEYAAAQGRSIASDPEPEKGYFFRSDHLEFLRKGVPALFFLNPGAEYLDKPADFGEKKRLQYLQHDYHKFSDKIKPDWDMSGVVEDAQLLFLVGLKVADSPERPMWKPLSEFNSAIKK